MVQPSVGEIYTKTGKECYIAFYIPAKLCLNHIEPHETLRLFQGKTLADAVDHFLSPICLLKH